jgi:disulfide oxidoreductase YuzD
METDSVNLPASKDLIEWVLGLLPENTGNSIKIGVEMQVRHEIREITKQSIDKFCEENNLCPLCITGGWNCPFDHK